VTEVAKLYKKLSRPQIKVAMQFKLKRATDDGTALSTRNVKL